MKPSSRRRERILVFGVGGSGKSHAYAQIAQRMSGTTMWVIETDPTLDAILEHPDVDRVQVREAWRNGVEDETWGPYLAEDGQVVVYRCTTWLAVWEAIAEVWERAGFEDWIVVDNITGPWEWVQAWYWQTVVGQEEDEFLLQIRKAQLEQLQAGETTSSEKANESKFNEWSFINPHFQKHFTDRMLNPPCHLYLTAEQTDVVKHFDEKQKETWGLYGMLGTKPKGQKKSGHLTHTVLHLSKSKAGEYRMTTVKDRGGREEWTRERWDDFAEDYLVGTAGWTDEEGTGTWTTGSKSSTSSTTSPSTGTTTGIGTTGTAGTTGKPKPKPKPKVSSTG